MLHRLLTAILCGLILWFSPAATRLVPAISGLHSLTTQRQVTGGSAYTPDQIATAYDFAPLYKQGIDGTGQTVALIEIGKADPADLQVFDTTYNLPPPTIKEYSIGLPFHVGSKDDETTLDVEWLHALAPGAAIQIYYLTDTGTMRASWRSMASALRMAGSRGASIISISLGTCGAGRESRVTQATLSSLTRRGVTVFVSSGDDGDHAGPVKDCGRKLGVSYPGSDPSVVSVGGTSVLLNDDNTIASEVGWRWSGGGRAKPLIRPAWQALARLPKDRYRWAPDVAFLADPHRGLRMYLRGRWIRAGGTSVGAPVWAAAWSLVREQAQRSGMVVGTAAPLLYRLASPPKYANVFHDVTVGSNGHYRAHRGWDPVTGWGTPDVSALATAVETVSPSRR